VTRSARTRYISATATIAGDLDRILQELRQIRAAGAELVIINPVGDELAQFEIVAEELLPRLRGAAPHGHA
jgi:hypothetical protein